MEEAITRSIKRLIIEECPKYLNRFSSREPPIILNNFYTVIVGQPDRIDGYPGITIVSVGWNKVSDDLIYTANQDIIDLYRYVLTVYLEGDDPELLEYMSMRYREALKECFRDFPFLYGTARGCIFSSGDNFNNIAGEQAIELSFKMNLDVYGMDQDSIIKVQ